MDITACIQSVIEDEVWTLPAMTEENRDILVRRLKDKANEYWYRDPRVSYKLGTAIYEIGRTYNDKSAQALGLMAQGDAIKHYRSPQEAWDVLEAAGTLFQSAGNAVGWARTRIGMAGICLDVGKLTFIEEDVARARVVLQAVPPPESYIYLLNLENNVAVTYDHLGDFHTAMTYYARALALADALAADYPNQGERDIAMLLLNIGYAHEGFGRLSEALAAYERAYHIYQAREDAVGAATAQLNIGVVKAASGQYRQALNLLHEAEAKFLLLRGAALGLVWYDMVEAHQALNQLQEAYQRATSAVAHLEADGSRYLLARLLVLLGSCAAETGRFEEAQKALERAETLFHDFTTSLTNAAAWQAKITLQKARIEYRLEHYETALALAQTALDYFEAHNQQTHYAQTLVLMAEAAFDLQRLAETEAAAHTILTIAAENDLPTLRYSGHLLLGLVFEQRGDRLTAMHCYETAAAVVDALHPYLPITLRSTFLQDKQEARQRLIQLHLHARDFEKAFIALEQAKGQLWLTHLLQQPWLLPQERGLYDDFMRLREQHHWYYRVTHDEEFRQRQGKALSVEDTRAVYLACEQQMRAITHRLFLNSREPYPLDSPSIEDIQAHLNAADAMIVFYQSVHELGAFILTPHSLTYQALPDSRDAADQIKALRTHLQNTIHGGNPLPRAFLRTSQSVYKALIAPLMPHLSRAQRLFIVPYGPLHHLPFNLLHDGQGYLIERVELVLLPTSNLLARPAPRRKPGAVVLGCTQTWQGETLKYTLDEARMVQQQMGGACYLKEEATARVLEQPPAQVLHIAAHAEFREDQPEFSFVLLGDGQLYTTDLLQYDLSYELVVLSACETGRAHVSPIDDLVGLGRSLLFAGAGALVVSLWPTNDALTYDLMAAFYHHLKAGCTKSAALRQAQLEILPAANPALWGAFQLIGSADELSST